MQGWDRGVPLSLPPGFSRGSSDQRRGGGTEACLLPARCASVAVQAISDEGAGPGRAFFPPAALQSRFGRSATAQQRLNPRCDAAPRVAVGAWPLLVPEPGLVRPGRAISERRAINGRRVFTCRTAVGGRWVISAGRASGTDAVGAQSRTLLPGRRMGMIVAAMSSHLLSLSLESILRTRPRRAWSCGSPAGPGLLARHRYLAD
jgi:hypothetical protein